MPAANCLSAKHSRSDMRNRCRDWTVLGSVLRVPEWRIGRLSREIVAQDGQLQDVGPHRFRRGERVRKRRGRAKVSLRGYRHRTARYVNASWTSVEEEKKSNLGSHRSTGCSLGRVAHPYRCRLHIIPSLPRTCDSQKPHGVPVVEWQGVGGRQDGSAKASGPGAAGQQRSQRRVIGFSSAAAQREGVPQGGR
jgi:hypothetical protein